MAILLIFLFYFSVLQWRVGVTVGQHPLPVISRKRSLSNLAASARIWTMTAQHHHPINHQHSRREQHSDEEHKEDKRMQTSRNKRNTEIARGVIWPIPSDARMNWRIFLLSLFFVGINMTLMSSPISLRYDQVYVTFLPSASTGNVHSLSHYSNPPSFAYSLFFNSF